MWLARLGRVRCAELLRRFRRLWLSAPQPWRRLRRRTPISAGPAIAAGIGGFALGAIAGGALANSGPPVVYAPAPVYVAPPPVCWVERRPVFDEYGEVIGSRPRRVCE